MTFKGNDLRGILAVLISTSCVTSIANAQESETASDETVTVTEQTSDEKRFDSVITTGTRIQGLAEDGAVQAFSIDRELIEESGALSIIEVLQDLPTTGGGTGTFSTSTAGATSSSTPPGSASVSLRGLGASSTLTLVNGRRASVASFASGQENFVDVNSLPLAALERVDVLPSGASAIYGADAVAGVVNYILRDDFDGFEVQSSYGNSTADTDEGKFNLNAVWGKTTDRQSFLLVGDYYKRNALYDRDREETAESVRSSQQGFYPSFNDLFLMFNDQTEAPEDGGCAEEDFFDDGSFGDYCQVNTNDFIATNDELESYNLVGAYKFRISDKLTWFNDAMYSSTESRGTSSPANFSRTPVNPENPFFPQGLVDDIVEEANIDNPGTIYEDFFGFPIFAWGKVPESRAVEVESETLRLTTGLKLEADSGWLYETALVYGRNEQTQRGVSGLYKSQEFEDTLLGNACDDGTTVDALDGESCEDNGATTLWYNPFGGQTEQDQAVLDYIETDAERNGTSTLLTADVSATGDLFEWNNRMIQAAFGAELRSEDLEDTPSGDAVATDDNPDPILGFSSTSVDASRTQWAAYGEFYIPVTDQLDIQLAGRLDSDENYGEDFNPKVAFRYAPIEPLIFRGNWSTSFRAPSLAQIGAGTRLTSYTVNCGVTERACGFDEGNPAEVAQANGTDGNSLMSEEIGNPDLEAEEAETWSIGAVFKPNADFEFSIDYWNIYHENLVGVNEDDFIRRALNGEFEVVDGGTLQTGVAGLERRLADHDNDPSTPDRLVVSDAHFELSNLGYQETSGIDFMMTKYFELGDMGDLSFTFDGSYLLEFETQASPDAEVIDEAGEYSYPELELTSRLRWSNGPWRTSLSANYTSSYKDDPSFRTREALNIGDDEEVEVDAWTVFDASISYDYAENSFIQLKIDNLLDEDAPRALATSANVDFYNHNTLGRYVTLRVGHAF